jgi:NADH:ubiquinone reductase (H+-translocating)
MAANVRPRVVIVGAGFAGLWAARTLAGRAVDVTLVDQNNYHAFLPLLYQVAAAEIEPEGIAYPVRTFLRRTPNLHFDLARVERIALTERRLVCEDHGLEYDYLIVANGSESAFFGVPGAEEWSFPLKTMDEAVRLRNHILSCFEHAQHETDPEAVSRRLTFVVVGGGATGVEFVGALAELIQGPLRRDFPALDFSKVRILQLEGKDRLLAMMPERLQAYTRRRLERMGVEVRLGTAVGRVTPDGVHLNGGETIPSETVVWTAGVCGSLASPLGELELTRSRRVPVLPSLQVEGFPEVYVAGDLASFRWQGAELPMVAPVAMAQGIWAARNVLLQASGRTPRAFLYRDKGTMVTIGRNAGVARFGRFSFKGFPAWMLWLLVHLMKLVGFRNRLLVLINWAWDYLFFERSVRLILPAPGERDPADPLT